MIRACAAIAIFALTPQPAIAAVLSDNRITLPLPVEARLCQVANQELENCRERSLAAGDSLRDFIRQAAGKEGRYELWLALPAGTFELPHGWLLDGQALPRQVTGLHIQGAKSGTRLSGARSLDSLGATLHPDTDGLSITLPADARAELLPRLRNNSGEPAWPALVDSQAAFRLTRWPAEGWARFSADSPISSLHLEPDAWLWGFFRFGWHADFAPALALAEAARYGVGDQGRYRVVNLRSELRTPGEYFIDTANGRLLAKPRPGTTPASLRLTCASSPLLWLRNASGVEVRGIEFADTRGHGLLVENGRDVHLTGLGFRNIGRAGVVVDGGQRVHLRDSRFEDLGDQAVILRGGNRATLQPSGHRVENCEIRWPSQRLNTPATAIRLEGVGHVVLGNTISDTPHSALYFDGNDHVIEGNWIERTCLDVDDAGAIYAGRDWTARGTVIRGNVFSQIRAIAPNTTAAAVYLDDMLSGIRVEQNLMVDVGYGVLVGGGRDNVITGNLFLRAAIPLHVDERARTWAYRAVTPGEVMDQRLSAVPVRSERWRAAYPRLASMPRDRAAFPEGNEIHDNLVIASGASALVASAIAGGQVEVPRTLATSNVLPGARDLLAYCAREKRCAPFQPPAAQP